LSLATYGEAECEKTSQQTDTRQKKVLYRKGYRSGSRFLELMEWTLGAAKS